MRKWLKRLGYALIILIIVIVVAVVAAITATDGRLNKSYDVPAAALKIGVPTDQAAIDEGKRLMTIRDCFGCHTENLGGGVLVDDPAIGKIYARNLTKGSGGVGQTFQDADYVRAIRHGLDENGKPLVGMPSDQFFNLSDDDLGRMLAYIKSVPPVDNQTPARSLTSLAKVLFAMGFLGDLPAEMIDHSVTVDAPKPAVSADYGHYLAGICIGCHNPSYSGGKVQFGPPDAPPAANLTPAGDLAKWSEQDFITTIRTGTTPEGKQLNPFMPWQSLSKMTDDELKAVFMFLKTLPPKATGEQ